MQFKPQKIVKTKKGSYRKKRRITEADILSFILLGLVIGYVAARSLIG